MDLMLTGGARRSAPRNAFALVALCAVLAACGDRQERASQTAAKVNKDEITVHQINFALQQQRVRPEQSEAAARQVLERLIDQQLALQKADDLKLDREPRVVQQLETARREILARAYFDKIGEGAAKPTADEIRGYFEAKPALFRERRVYNLQEILIDAPAEQVPALRQRLAQSADVAAFVEHLKAEGIRYTGNQIVRGAEQLPLAAVDRIAAMKEGEAMVTPTPAGLQVLVVVGSRAQPVSEEQARGAIEQFMLNDRRRQMVEADLKTLREAAAIEYVGRFAAAASAPGGSAANGGQADGLADAGKGLGLK
ncbi:EpsD family peptidyl-prolyl cis-trans isomerase [Rubrivivax gelatinosus]|uniref:EpsD family peptidyl-prolyl cis-trans isomerase n=1 Tax=Rubrivivax gelatinosus TaxID=28068 RepID=A0A4R2MEP1_RUBGE|nr:EpsD family peptidyl-prolyl cis-trans isomerase [Rubrivivax gelatinosus]MBK1687690.1 peptidyl-prolyl cis-trans isomerase, EpsD family [Rubrivivax gelatinosus]TCP01126.1 EpsD family peptidyl-prolyl cis-trans isomerase [Rubrivivax gelatinosus]